MNVEQEILNAFERGKGFGIAEGMRMMRLKELTNDEIMQIAMEASDSNKNWGYFQIDFARAILKKAGEK